MGVAVGDFDNDGWPDMLVTAYGKCILYKNNHDGTFTDVTEKAGVATPGWTTSAVWFDYDNDGRLDLFLCSFVDYSGTHKFECGDNKLGKHYYCIPRVFKGTASFLYHNNGDGTFTDVTKGTDIAKSLGKGLGRCRHRHQQRRPHGPVCRERHRAELSVSSIADPARTEPGSGKRLRFRPKSRSVRTDSRAPAWASMQPI